MIPTKPMRMLRVSESIRLIAGSSYPACPVAAASLRYRGRVERISSIGRNLDQSKPFSICFDQQMAPFNHGLTFWFRRYFVPIERPLLYECVINAVWSAQPRDNVGRGMLPGSRTHLFGLKAHVPHGGDCQDGFEPIAPEEILNTVGTSVMWDFQNITI